MKEKPILFKPEMVRKVLSGEKTQTRRIVNGNALMLLYAGFTPEYLMEDGNSELRPYYIGQILWVRETWWQCTNNNDRIYYAASETPVTTKDRSYRKRPSIFLERINSRINLEITNIRVERIQNISEDDSQAEGTTPYMAPSEIPAYKPAFADLWNSINEPRGFGWNLNPWVFAITFKVVK